MGLIILTPEILASRVIQSGSVAIGIQDDGLLYKKENDVVTLIEIEPSFNSFTESYQGDSSSFDERINSVTGSGGGTPSEPTNSIQYNNNGNFGGTDTFTWDGNSLTIGTDDLYTLYPAKLKLNVTASSVLGMFTITSGSATNGNGQLGIGTGTNAIPSYYFIRSYGDIGSSSVDDSIELGRILYSGFVSGSLDPKPGASIQGVSADDWGSGRKPGFFPTRLDFYVAPDTGSPEPALALRLRHDSVVDCVQGLRINEYAPRAAAGIPLTGALQYSASHFWGFDSSEWLQLDGGGSGNLFTDITYHALTELIVTETLGKGLYRITDFQTKHQIPYTNVINIGNTEPLIVLATSTASIDHKAYSELYPQDIIHYDWSSMICEDGLTLRPGKITYRKDTQYNLETYYDWRNVKFRRFKIDENTLTPWTASETYYVDDVVSYEDKGVLNIYTAMRNIVFTDENPTALYEWCPVLSDIREYYYLHTSGETYGNVSLYANTSSFQDYYTFAIQEDLTISSGRTGSIGYYNMYIGPTKPNDQELNNVIFISGISKGAINCYENTISYNSVDTTFLNGTSTVYNNNIKFADTNLIIRSSFRNNNYLQFQKNIIKSNVHRNNNSDTFTACIINPDYIYNNIKYANNIYTTANYNFEYNNIELLSILKISTQLIYNQFNVFNNNTLIWDDVYKGYNNYNIGQTFSNNVISGSIYNNNLNTEFGTNTLNTSFMNNSIQGTSFINNNIVGNTFNNNIIRCTVDTVNFDSSTHVANDYECNIYLPSGSSTPKLRYYDDSDNINYKNITD